MFRFVLSAVALAGLLVTAHPAFADQLPGTASDHAQPVATATKQSAPLESTWSLPSDAVLPARAVRGKAVPVGFGWG
jgi:hypothetical protein